MQMQQTDACVVQTLSFQKCSQCTTLVAKVTDQRATPKRNVFTTQRTTRNWFWPFGFVLLLAWYGFFLSSRLVALPKQTKTRWNTELELFKRNGNGLGVCKWCGLNFLSFYYGPALQAFCHWKYLGFPTNDGKVDLRDSFNSVFILCLLWVEAILTYT